MEAILFITGVVGLITAIVVFAKELRVNIKEIHVLVNDRMTEAINRIDQLTETLHEAGVTVPKKPDS